LTNAFDCDVVELCMFLWMWSECCKCGVFVQHPFQIFIMLSSLKERKENICLLNVGLLSDVVELWVIYWNDWLRVLLKRCVSLLGIYKLMLWTKRKLCCYKQLNLFKQLSDMVETSMPYVEMTDAVYCIWYFQGLFFVILDALFL